MDDAIVGSVKDEEREKVDNEVIVLNMSVVVGMIAKDEVIVRDGVTRGGVRDVTFRDVKEVMVDMFNRV